jgi:hypothetical protein
VLLREEILPRRSNRRANQAAQFIDLAEPKLWVRTYGFSR